MVTCTVAGGAQNGELAKVQFGRIARGQLVYDAGEDDHSVFQGKCLYVTIYMTFSMLENCTHVDDHVHI